MAVPIYLMFRADEVLTEEGVRFSRRRLEALADTGKSAKYFCSIPFDDVYHDGPIRGPRKEEIKNARHAEALVPEKLDLKHLRFIVCRSDAEKVTLLSLLDEEAKALWQEKITLAGSRAMFFKEWNYVESVHCDVDHTIFRFHRATSPSGRGPFALEIKWLHGDGRIGGFSRASYELQQSLKMNLNRESDAYTVEVRLDGHLVCRAHFHASAGPTLY